MSNPQQPPHTHHAVDNSDPVNPQPPQPEYPQPAYPASYQAHGQGKTATSYQQWPQHGRIVADGAPPVQHVGGSPQYEAHVQFSPGQPPTMEPPISVPPLLRSFSDDDRSTTANDLSDYDGNDAPIASDAARLPNADDLYTGSPEQIERRRVRRQLIGRLRTEASEILSQRVQEREADVADPDKPGVLPYTAEDREQLGRSIAQDLARTVVSEAVAAGEEPISVDEQSELIDAIFNQLFRLGNIQHLIDEEGVEDIYINGPYTYVADPKTGSKIPRPPAFDTDDEIIEWLQFQAGRAPGGGRAFDKTSPELRLNLPGGIRLSAMAFTSERPTIAIRQHRLRNITLDTLVDYGVMPPTLSRMLAAATLGAMSIVVAGPMGAGKTTMIRALANELPIDTRIGTAETEFELMLKEIPGREPFVVANEVITGGGERNQLTNELVGKTSLTDILYGYVRQMLDRIIVGEVAGPEIIAMYQAMQFCEGTLSTTHATSAAGAIDRLVTIALANGGLDRTYAERQAAHHIDLIVQLQSDRIFDAEGNETRNRYVKEVAYVEQGENDRAALTMIYKNTTGKHGEGNFGSIPEPMLNIITNAGFPRSELPGNTLDYSLGGKA